MNKMCINKVILLILTFCCVTVSRSQFYFDGYLLTLNLVQLKKTPFAFSTHNDFHNINRIRLRPRIELSDNLNLIIEHESFIHYRNNIEYFSEKYESVTGQLLNLNFIVLNSRIWQVTHFIDRMYMKIDLDKINLTLGRQRIAWGTGRIWNPTDLFNPISPTNFAKIEKDGVDAALIKYNLASLSDLSIVINPTKNKSNYALRYRTNFSEFDVSFMGGKFQNEIVFGADFAGNFLNAGVRGEMIISRNIMKFIAGADYQLSPKIYTLMEYHFNGAGKSNKKFYEIYNLVNNNSIYLAKSYIIFQISYIAHPLSSISFLINKNLNDNSSFLSLNLSYSLLDNLNVNWITNIFSGNRYSEYWYYPSNLIIRSEYYF